MAREELIKELRTVKKDMEQRLPLRENIIFITSAAKISCSMLVTKMIVLCGRGYTAKEISSILGVPESDVENYIKLCRKTHQEVKDSISEN